MKHNFLKKLMALLLSTFMVLSLVPAITFTANAADKTVTVSIEDYADENGWANDKSYDKLIMDENITVTTSGGGNTGKYYTSGYDWRFYQTNTSKLIITASGGATIKTVKITYTNSNSGILTYSGSNKTSNTVITVNATSATFGVGNTGTSTKGQVRITAIEVVYSKSACEHLNKGPAGVEQKPTCDEPGLTAGVKCLDCGVTITAQETISAKGHTLVNGVCSVCGTKLSGYVLVTDASTLQVGDKIIIVAKDYNYALSTTQNGNNRGQVEITKNDENTVSFVEGVQIITLGAVEYYDGAPAEKKLYAFNTGDGYLYAASSSKNYLRTQVNNNANGHWTIEIDSEGGATIKAQGDNTNNWLRYNSTSSLFSCYGSGQQDVSIYKLVEETTEPCTHEWENGVCTKCQDQHTEHTGGTATCQKGEVCEVCGKEYGEINANNHVDATGKYTSNENGTHSFNRTCCDATDVASANCEYNNNYVCTLCGYSIAPKITGFSLSLNKGITIKVKITIDQKYIDIDENSTEKVVFSNGKTFDPVVGTHEYSIDLKPTEFNSAITVSYGILEDKDVSVAKYISLVEADEKASGELKALVAAIAAYGKAINGVDEEITATFDPEKDKYTPVQDENAKVVTGMQAKLDVYANLYINFADFANGYTYAITKGGENLATGTVAGSQLVIENFYPKNYNDEYTLTVKDGETTVATVTFTFNAYLNELYNSTDDSATKSLVAAVYQYGLATEAYEATRVQ